MSLLINAISFSSTCHYFIFNYSCGRCKFLTSALRTHFYYQSGKKKICVI